MKKLVIALAATAATLVGCQEKGPVIAFDVAGTFDTTYTVATIPAADPHNVLVEEYTGQSCTNCPAAHELLGQLEDAHPGRLNVMGLYITGPIQTKPPTGYKYDFRTEDATLISQNIYGGVNLLPSAGIDRYPVVGNLKVDKGSWGSAIEAQLTKEDSINVKVTSTLDAANNEADITVTVTYLKDINFSHYLSVVILEDSLIDIQEYPSTDPVHPYKDDNYVFTNVLRKMITSAPLGNPILDSVSVKPAGMVFQRKYNKHSLTGYNIVDPTRCKVVAFVNANTGSSYRVLQSVQTPLKGN